MDKAGTENTSDVDAEVYYHRIGTPQCECFVRSRLSLCNLTLAGSTHPADDILVLKDPEHADWMWSTSVSEVDGRYLQVIVSKDSSRVRTLLSRSGIGPTHIDIVSLT